MSGKTLGELSSVELESLGSDYKLAVQSIEDELSRRYGPEHVPTPIAEGIEGKSDAELAALLESYRREAHAAETEQKRRHDSAWGVRPIGRKELCSKRTAKEPCPNCGKRDAVRGSKTLYGDAELARHEAIGTAAICSCGAWFDPGTGKPIDMNSVYTY